MKRLLVLVPLLGLTACPPPPDSTDGGVDAGTQSPSVTSVSPTSGPVAGGTDVAIFGSNYEDGVRVFFGANEGTNVTRVTKGRVTAKTPAGAAAGAVEIKVVNPDGQEAVLAGAFTYETPAVKTIANAFIENPDQTNLTSTNASVQVAVTGVVNVTGTTEGVGAGAGVLAQVGHGADGANATDQNAFTWVDAAYVADVGTALENDRYSGNVTLAGPMGPDAVSYVLAARFSVDNGQSWIVADRDGSSNGPQSAQLSRVTLTKPKPNWCKLGGVVFGTEAVSLRTNQTSATIYAQVYHQGVTDQGSGAGAGVTAQLGYGAAGALVDANGVVQPAAFTWSNAAFNVDQGNNDEYQTVLATPAVGTYKYAYRVSLNGGPYLYCDADGADNGVAEAQLGTLTVAPVQIDSCRLQSPPSMVVPSGSQTYDIYGRVTALGVTDVTGAPANLTAEVGYGPAATAEASWTWSAASFNIDADGTTDEYKATFVAPAAGSYRYGYRFRYGGTGAYTYCDLDGSAVGGFTVAQAGRLDVPTLTDCKTMAIATTSKVSGELVTIEARVFGQGVTTTAGANAGIKAQIGLGAPQSNASASPLWGWGDATYLAEGTGADVGWDVYTVDARPAYGGSRAIAARFSSDNGQSWLYCDLNSFSVGGYEQAQQQSFTVAATSDVDYCNLQFPATAVAGMATPVFGQIYEPGVTEAPLAGAGITAWLGRGPSGEDPGISSAWTWSPAAFNIQAGNNDEFSAELPATVPVGISYAYRFQLLAGAWCFADLDGNGASLVSGQPRSFSGERQDTGGSTVDNLGRVVP